MIELPFNRFRRPVSGRTPTIYPVDDGSNVRELADGSDRSDDG